MNAYFVTEDEDYGGYVVIADSLEEAITIAYESGTYRVVLLGDGCGGIHGSELKTGNIEGLEKGVVELMDGLKRGLYSDISTNKPCPSCDRDSPYLFKNEESGKIYCQNDDCPARPVI